MTSSHPSPVLPRRRTSDLVVAAVLGVAGAAWLSWLEQPATVGHTSLARETLTMLVFVMPLVMVLVPLALYLTRRSAKREPSFPVSLLATVPVAAVAVSVGYEMHMVVAGHTVLTASAIALDATSVLVALLPLGALLLAGRDFRVSSPRRRARLAFVLGISVATALSTSTFTATTPTGAVPRVLTCLQGKVPDKAFDVTALDVDIPINRFGDHDPKGKMYTLSSKIDAVRAEETSQQVSVGLRDDAIQPLVIRANEGDCVEITFTNSATGGDFGMHIDGLEFTKSSSGDAVGTNAASGVSTGGTTTYRFAVPSDPRLEGAHYVHPGPGYRAAVDHGLFGTLMVEPPGSTYWDASPPDEPLESGWEAIVKPAGVATACNPDSHVATCAFREAALLHHALANANEQLTNKAGLLIPLVDGLTGTYRPGSFALNYRSQPFPDRLPGGPPGEAAPAHPGAIP